MEGTFLETPVKKLQFIGLCALTSASPELCFPRLSSLLPAEENLPSALLFPLCCWISRLLATDSLTFPIPESTPFPDPASQFSSSLELTSKEPFQYDILFLLCLLTALILILIPLISAINLVNAAYFPGSLILVTQFSRKFSELLTKSSF